MSGFTFEVTTTAPNEVFTLPTVSGRSYNATVYWGDSSNSSITAYDDPDIAHTFVTPDTYQVEITGQFDGWSVNNQSPTKTQITDIVTWGDSGDFDGFAYLSYGFYYCNLNSLGTGKILAKAGLTNLDGIFAFCDVSGSSIPSGLFDNCTNVTSLTSLFFGSNVAGAVPSGLFDTMTALTNVRRCFQATNITSVPDGLFRLNTSITDFRWIFESANSLVVNQYTFYLSGEENTRFLDQSINFTEAFKATSSRPLGTAPELWNCSFGTGTPTITDCFTGNSSNSLSNWFYIPYAWGGDYQGFQVEVTTTTPNEVFALPTVSGQTYNATVYWGDTSNSSITAYDDPDIAHTYVIPGTYTINIIGQFDGWSVDNISPTKTQITNIITWGRAENPDFDGFAYLSDGFYGCSNLESIGPDSILAKSGLTTLYNLFRACTSLTSQLQGDLLNNCSNVINANNMFIYCSGIEGLEANFFQGCASTLTTMNFAFSYCTSMTELESGLFNNLSSVASAEYMFFDSGLESLPENIFDDMTGCTSFDSCLRLCDYLTEVPNYLFRNNIACTDFSGVFDGAVKLRINPFVFYADGEQNTRFLNQSVNFSNCFNRTPSGAALGQAPDLWNCDFGTGTPTTTNCFGGNTLSQLINHTNVPTSFGGSNYQGTPPVIDDISDLQFATGLSIELEGSGFESDDLEIYLSDGKDFSIATLVQQEVTENTDSSATFTVDTGEFSNGQTLYILLKTNLDQINEVWDPVYSNEFLIVSIDPETASEGETVAINGFGFEKGCKLWVCNDETFDDSTVRIRQDISSLTSSIVIFVLDTNKNLFGNNYVILESPDDSSFKKSIAIKILQTSIDKADDFDDSVYKVLKVDIGSSGNLDLVLENGKFVFAKDGEAIVVGIRERLYTDKEEVSDILQESVGMVDFYGIIYNNNKPQSEKELNLKRAILSTPYITRITSWEWTQEERAVSLNFTAVGDLGTITINEVFYE